jgi:hypothetical protein
MTRPRTTLAAALAAPLLLLAPSAARAQSRAGVTPLFDASADSCLAALPDSERARVPVYESLTMVDSGYNTAPPAVENLMQVIADQVQVMLGAKSPVLARGEPRVGWRDLDPGMLVVWRRDGGLAWYVDDAPLRADTARARGAWLLADALESARAAGDFVMTWPTGNTADSIRFRLDLAWPWVDSVGTIHPAHVAVAVPVFSVEVPRERPFGFRNGMRPPRWPTTMLTAVEGTLIAQYVVDTTGRAEMSTFESVWPSDKPKPAGFIADYYDAFLKNIRIAVRDAEFNPERYGSCTVRQRVKQWFFFEVH